MIKVKIETETGGGETITFKSPIKKITLEYEDIDLVIAMKKIPHDVLLQVQAEVKK